MLLFILNLMTIQPKDYLYGVLNQKQNPSINERDNQLGLIHRSIGRKTKRKRGCKA